MQKAVVPSAVPEAPAQAPTQAPTQAAADTAGGPLNIVHCLRAPVGGLFRHVLDLAGEQARRGHRVGIIADSTSGDRLTDAKLDAIRPQLALGLERVAMPRQPGPGDWRAYARVRDIAAGLDLDVLHGHGAKGGAYARLVRRALGARGQRVAAFYTPHGGTLNFAPRSLEGRIFLTLEKAFDGLTDGIVFESGHAARAYGERIGGAADRRIVPNGLQPNDFAPRVPNPDAADVLFVGELRKLKGVDVLLRALAVIAATRDITAVIVGSGPDADAFKALAAELGLAHCVRFTGAMPAPQAFALGRIITVPSRKESFPYIVLEAAAAGIPLIATDVGGIPEIVAGSDTALLPPDEVDALAAALRSALDAPQQALDRALRLRSIVAERFTVTRMTDDILDFYRSATNS